MPKEIRLSPGQLIIVDDDVFEILSKHDGVLNMVLQKILAYSVVSNIIKKEGDDSV